MLSPLVCVCVLVLLSIVSVSAQIMPGTTGYGFESPTAVNSGNNYNYANGNAVTTGFTNPCTSSTCTSSNPSTYTPCTFDVGGKSLGSGISNNAGPFNPQNTPYAEEGTQYAFLQTTGGGMQRISCQLGGLQNQRTYALTYYYNQRNGYQGAHPDGLSLTSSITAGGTGTSVTSQITPSTNSWTQATFTFTATGTTTTATILFTSAEGTGSSDGDSSVLLDNLVLTAGSAIAGDPQLSGLRGQNFQVHGVDQMVYNLISSEDLQVNSRFVFLTEGKCPIVAGALTNCWSHPGSYLGSVGVKQRLGDAVERVALVSGPSTVGFASVELNGVAVAVDAQYHSCKNNSTKECFSLSYVNSHIVTISTPTFSFEFSNSDSFINQKVFLNVPLSKVNAHGLLGQTSTGKVWTGNSIKYIEGEVDDYSIEEDDIFGDSFMYNRYHQ